MSFPDSPVPSSGLGPPIGGPGREAVLGHLRHDIAGAADTLLANYEFARLGVEDQVLGGSAVRLLADLRAKLSGVAHEGGLRVNHVVSSRPVCPCVHVLAPSTVLNRKADYMRPRGKIKGALLLISN